MGSEQQTTVLGSTYSTTQYSVEEGERKGQVKVRKEEGE